MILKKKKQTKERPKIIAIPTHLTFLFVVIGVLEVYQEFVH